MSKFVGVFGILKNGYKMEYFGMNRISMCGISSSSVKNEKEDIRIEHKSEDTGPNIPIYSPRLKEDIKTKRARLLYQSRKRGMLENCLLLSTFANLHLDSMNDDELIQYDSLINIPTNEWDIYYWAIGLKPIPAQFDTPILKKFIHHVQNHEKESRVKQPDLY